MISYRPSQGNDVNRVGVTSEGAFFGRATGGPVLLSLRTDDKPKATYYNKWYTDLTNDSSYIFKSLSDIDFINGITVYRAIYVGASERHNDTEILGTIAASVNQDSGNPVLDNTVNISLWLEGLFSETPSKNSIVLDDENDSTGLLSGVTWTSSVSVTDPLPPGKFAKIWIKIEVPANAAIADFDGFNYIYNFGDLSITVPKEKGRISFSRLFKTSLNSDKLVLKETLPSGFGGNNYDGIFKIIKRDNFVNIFYINDGQDGVFIDDDPTQPEMRMLVIGTGDNLGENKFIDVNLNNVLNNSELFEDKNILEYIKIFECSDPLTVSTTDEFGDKVTADIEGSIVRKYEEGEVVSRIADEKVLGRKFILDVFMSEKEDINYAYVYYVQIASSLTPDEVLNYRHNQYTWVTKVLTIDLNHVNSALFERFDTGFDNRGTTIATYYEENTVKEYFYPTSVIKQNDLFTVCGYNVEDCYFENNKANLIYIWEKDLINKSFAVQEFDLPPNIFATQRSVFNEVENASVIKFGFLNQVAKSTDFNRSVDSIDASGMYSFVSMGAPHSRNVDHGYSSVSYDLENPRHKEFMATWAFTIDGDSVGSLRDQQITKNVSFDSENPQHQNLLYQQDFNSLNQTSITMPFTTRNWQSDPTPIFKLHCAGDIEAVGIDCRYHFPHDQFVISYLDQNCVAKNLRIIKDNFNIDSQNTISVRGYVHEVKGGTEERITALGFRISNNCHMKYLIFFEIYVNGELLHSDTACVLNHIDTYVITHNPNNLFSGKITYFEVKEPPESDVSAFAKAQHRLHSNIAWVDVGEEKDFVSQDVRFNKFNFRRKLSFKNLTHFDDTVVVPIVLYGNSYNISSFENKTINKNVQRSTFDFSKLSLNSNNFAFFVDKTFVELDWQADKYDFDNDLLVIWVKLPRWHGENIIMFYNDGISERPIVPKPYRDEYYGVWHMNEFYTRHINRYDSQKIFNSGEALVVTNNNNVINITQINDIYPLGFTDLYKSNKFDVEYDDRAVHRKEAPNVNEFIEDTVRLFKPAYMEIRDVKSKFDYKLEADNSGD